MTLKEIKDKRNQSDWRMDLAPAVSPSEKDDSPTILDGVVANCVRVNLRSKPELNLDNIIMSVDNGTSVNVYPDKSTDKYWFVKTVKNEGFIDKRYVKIA